ANKSYIVLAKFFHTETSPSETSRTERLLQSKPCTFNSSYIMVNDTDGTLIKKFCVDQLPPPISSTGSKLFITYVFRTPAAPPPTELPPGNGSSTPRPSTTFEQALTFDLEMHRQ